MSTYHLLRVFCDGAGEFGNQLGVFLHGDEVGMEKRQAIAADLGFAETVFVDDRERGDIRIFTPSVELGFAGHPTVGTAWLLAREGSPVGALRPPAGEVGVRCEGDLAFVSARPEWGPEFEHVELDSAAEVESLQGPPGSGDLIAAWAWADEAAGLVRSRVFPVEIGIEEDEATGSAAARLCALLDREIEIVQGRGSHILARPAGDGMIEIGGRSVLDEVREYALP
ncbi:MAG TPA: PhzF family phenazine biosynthesis protein [Thermoleophilaceae bacterium]|nr:PhzF family phenazine biosynthesis protein [Thermoleophilaceae bacterium]